MLGVIVSFKDGGTEDVFNGPVTSDGTTDLSRVDMERGRGSWINSIPPLFLALFQSGALPSEAQVIYTALSERLSAERSVFGNLTPTLCGRWDDRYAYRTGRWSGPSCYAWCPSNETS